MERLHRREDGADGLDGGAERLGRVLGHHDREAEDFRGLGQLDEIGGDLVAADHLDMEPLLHVDEDEDRLVALQKMRVHQ